MAQYIEKSALVAEIKRRIEEITLTISLGDKKIQKSGGNRRAELVMLLSFLDTLDVQEVDLIKEVENWKIDHQVYGMDETFCDFAKHFFGLGIAVSNKAQKGE